MRNEEAAATKRRGMSRLMRKADVREREKGDAVAAAYLAVS